MEPNLVIFVDFDGTISRQDVSQAMLERFCTGDWKQLNLLWEQGQLNTAECANELLAMMQASETEMEHFFDEQEIDPAFTDFLFWAQENDFPVYVLSDGFDNYIRSILTRFNVELPFFANHLHYAGNGSWAIESPFADKQCQQCGVCKKRLVELLRTDNSLAVYIGDGYSDACAAPGCDLIFARDRLAEILSDLGSAYEPFTDFDNIKQQLESLLANKTNRGINHE